jgi:hypothetical protein
MLKILLIIFLLVIIGAVLIVIIRIGIALLKILIPCAIVGAIVIFAMKFFGCLSGG